MFHDRLTAHGDVFRGRKDSEDIRGIVNINDGYGGLVPMVEGGQYLDSEYEDWMSKALQLWNGNMLSSAHGAAELNPPINPLDEAHDIIERPLTTNSPAYNRETEDEKFANSALENVLRFQENWSGKKVTFRGSIIDLWYAEIARGEWEYGDYYTAPQRDWGYDNIYRMQAPPGMTRVFGVEEIFWTRTTWAAEGL